MNIVKKVIDINLKGEDLKAVYDMRSVVTFKQLYGKPLLNSMKELENMDEEVLLYFMASTFRKGETSKPIGKELLQNYDLMYLLMNYSEKVLELITASMPQANVSNEKK